MASANDTFIRDLKKVIDENLSNQDLNVELLADKLYMSHSSLYRKIQALTGETPKLFIRSYRLQQALRLLKSNFGNITEVAFGVGFSSTAYFSRCFKTQFNCSPSDFLAKQELSEEVV